MPNIYFKIREGYSSVVDMLTYEQAGKLFKGFCAYVFYGIPFESTDRKVQAAFEVIKKSLDSEIRGREFGLKFGRIGGLRSQEIFRQKIIENLNKPNDEEDDMSKGA